MEDADREEDETMIIEKEAKVDGTAKGGAAKVRGDAEKGANLVEDEYEDMMEVHNVEDQEIEETGGEDDDDDGSDSGDSFIDDEEDEDPTASGNGVDPNNEVPLTEAEIEELIRELLEVESKAAEAQESLEKESLEQVEKEVRAELSQNLDGDELENAASAEMKAFIEQWEMTLDDLETESALLLEQLDGAGIALPSLYKWIESQAPNGCSTEAWRKTHWVGCEVTFEAKELVNDAEKYLQSCRPVRRQHGKLLEEGASGFLARKIGPVNDGQNASEALGKDWNLFNKFIHSHKNSGNSLSFGSSSWASVYLASTPQQAANLGLKLPGVDEVEEIDEVQIDSHDPFYADAVANEKDIDLSEEQQRNFRKVTEENDANITKKLQHQLKRHRHKRRHQLPGNSFSEDGGFFSEVTVRKGKRAHTGEDMDSQSKRHQTVVIDSDDEVEVVDKYERNICPLDKSDRQSSLQANEVVDVIDVDAIPSSSSHGLLRATQTVKDFHCTACFDILSVSKVRKHPLLGVIICKQCKCKVEEKMQHKETDLTKYYCSWCTRCNDLVCCSSCKMSFCSVCINRNLGEEQLLESRISSWRCCCCSPNLLQKFISLYEEALDSMATSSSGSGSELSDSGIAMTASKRKKQKRRIRRIIDDAELGEETKQKIEMEKARQEHLKSMRFGGQLLTEEKKPDETILLEGSNTVFLGDATSGYIVNVAREEDEGAVKIPPSISTWLKPHQVSGIRFMWENIIQSVKKVKSGDKGLGCILAHTMGLGKTFQVIAFLYTAMRCVDLGFKTALIVTPVNVLHNWRQEFMKWKPSEVKALRIFMLEDVARERRTYLLSKWKQKGGILLIGYAAFRNLSFGKYLKDRATATEICHALQNVPDILVCDEAHIIKNKRADTTQALKQVKTQRRIALTGSPLQNNLMEYYCMVDFVREGFLGSSHEFRNRFQNPIENGQHANSTADDVKIMNQRSHILYEQLKGFVQRMGLNVVKKDLPPKTVYVISVKLSALQRKLYKRFLDVHGFTNGKILNDKVAKGRCFFAGYQALAQIWNHPGLLQMGKEPRDNLIREDLVDKLFDDDSSSDDNDERGDIIDGDKQRSKTDSAYKKTDGILFNEEIDWWEDLLREKIYKEVEYSGKMVLLLDILLMSSEVGDKALVFSQSLSTLSLIELFLSKLPRKGSEGKYWKQGKDWYRLDGSTAGSERQKLVEKFNDPSNKRVKCTLISTRAGSLGINLYSANRVVIVDGSWNPTHDLQAIYRVWRYGQVKPVYAYRLMAHGTMEDKIYKRQVTKEGLAARVVDRQQIYRTMSKEEVLHLFEFGDDEIADILDQDNNGELANYLERKPLSFSNGVGLSDKFMESLLNRHYPRWIQDYHEHETLLQENEEERLSKEEQDMAWETFLRTVEWEEVNRVSIEQPQQAEQKVMPRNPLPCPELRDRQTVQESRIPASMPETSNVSVRSGSKSSRQPPPPRKCSNLSHLLTLRSQGTKSGSSTICGECSQEISWENLNRDGRIR